MNETIFDGKQDLSGPLQAVNEQWLQLLSGSARRPNSTGEFVDSVRDELRSLFGSERIVASRCPFLLVDMQFRNAAWWRATAAHPTMKRSVSPSSTSLPRQAAIKLARACLVLAWHAARTDRDSALVFLGLSRPVGELIRMLSPQQIDRIAECQFVHLRPQWQDRPAVWRHLLSGLDQGPDGIGDFAIRAIQLIVADWVPCQAGAQGTR